MTIELWHLLVRWGEAVDCHPSASPACHQKGCGCQFGSAIVLLRGIPWSNSTRLLKTAIKGVTVAIVTSSWIDALGGLVLTTARSVPPDFCAAAGPLDCTVAAASCCGDRTPIMSPSPVQPRLLAAASL